MELKAFGALIGFSFQMLASVGVCLALATELEKAYPVEWLDWMAVCLFLAGLCCVHALYSLFRYLSILDKKQDQKKKSSAELEDRE